MKTATADRISLSDGRIAPPGGDPTTAGDRFGSTQTGKLCGKVLWR